MEAVGFTLGEGLGGLGALHFLTLPFVGPDSSNPVVSLDINGIIYNNYN
jgi:hypothetical protein